MCETEQISRSIVRLSKRTFDYRLKAVSSQKMEQKGVLTRLNNQLDSLYDTLYEAYPEMSEADYRFLSPYLSILIDTLKKLYSAYQKLDTTSWMKEANERLSMNISAIEEIEHDIRNFKINLHQNPRYQKVIDLAKRLG